MKENSLFSPERLEYLQLLSKQYPTVQSASNEVIRLEAILNLPKGTEHFMSDIHGEHEAFLHILNSSSGEVKEKLLELFSDTLTPKERNDLATLIYYPKSKLALMAEETEDLDEFYRVTLNRLVQLCRHVSTKHTRESGTQSTTTMTLKTTPLFSRPWRSACGWLRPTRAPCSRPRWITCWIF